MGMNINRIEDQSWKIQEIIEDNLKRSFPSNSDIFDVIDDGRLSPIGFGQSK